MSLAPSVLPFDSLFIAPPGDAALTAALPPAEGPAAIQGFGEMLAALTPMSAAPVTAPTVRLPLTPGSAPAPVALRLQPSPLPPSGVSLPTPPAPRAMPLADPVDAPAVAGTESEATSQPLEAPSPEMVGPRVPPAHGVRRREAVAALPAIDPETGRAVPPGKLLQASRAIPEGADPVLPTREKTCPAVEGDSAAAEVDASTPGEGIQDRMNLPDQAGATTLWPTWPPAERVPGFVFGASREAGTDTKPDEPVVTAEGPVSSAEPVFGESARVSSRRSTPAPVKAEWTAYRSERVEAPARAPKTEEIPTEAATLPVDPAVTQRPLIRSRAGRNETEVATLAKFEPRDTAGADAASGGVAPVVSRDTASAEGHPDRLPGPRLRPSEPLPTRAEPAEPVSLRPSPPPFREEAPAAVPASLSRPNPLPTRSPVAEEDGETTLFPATEPAPEPAPQTAPRGDWAAVPAMGAPPAPAPTPVVLAGPPAPRAEAASVPPLPTRRPLDELPRVFAPVAAAPSAEPMRVAPAGERPARTEAFRPALDAAPAPDFPPVQEAPQPAVKADAPTASRELPAAVPAWAPAIGLRGEWTERPGRGRNGVEKSAGPVANGRDELPAIFAEEASVVNSGSLTPVNQAFKRSPVRVGTENAKLATPMPSASSSLRAAAPEGTVLSPAAGVTVAPAAPTFPVTMASPTDVARETAAASALQAVREVLEVAERLADAPRSSGSVQVRLDDVGVSVRVECRDGEVRATFVTDSSDLRDHLAAAWQAHAASGEGRNLRLAEPVFTTSSNPATSASFSGQGQTSGGDAGRQFAAPSPHAPPFAGSGASSRGGSAGTASAPTAGEVQSASSHRLLAFA